MASLSPSYAHENTSTTLNAEQIDTLVMLGNTTLESIGYGYTTIGASGKLPGGWQTKWINTQGMGNHGELVIIPGDQRTSVLYGYAMEQKARNTGLNPELASIWASSQVQYKHELLDVLVHIVNDPQLFLAYLAFPDNWEHGAIRNWIKEHNITEEHSAHRRTSIKLILKEFCRNSNALPYSQTVKSAINGLIKNSLNGA